MAAASSATNPISAPSAQALEPAAPRKFEKISCTLSNLLIGILAISILGNLYLVYQAWQLRNALQEGNLDQAEMRIQKGGWKLYQYAIDSDTIRSLAKTQPDSVQFVTAQIDWAAKLAAYCKKENDQDTVFVPLDLSNAQEAVIGARDGDVEHSEAEPTVAAIVPRSVFPRTYLHSSYSMMNDDYGALERTILYEPQTHVTLAPYRRKAKTAVNVDVTHPDLRPQSRHSRKQTRNRIIPPLHPQVQPSPVSTPESTVSGSDGLRLPQTPFGLEQILEADEIEKDSDSDKGEALIESADREVKADRSVSPDAPSSTASGSPSNSSDGLSPVAFSSPSEPPSVLIEPASS